MWHYCFSFLKRLTREGGLSPLFSLSASHTPHSLTHTHLTAIVDKSVHCLSDGGVWWLAALHLGFVVVLKVRPHHEEVLPPFIHRNLGFSLNHRVDSSNCGFTRNESTMQLWIHGNLYQNLNQNVVTQRGNEGRCELFILLLNDYHLQTKSLLDRNDVKKPFKVHLNYICILFSLFISWNLQPQKPKETRMTGLSP